MLEKLVLRIQELEQIIEKSAANHNSMIGALQEVKNLYHMFVESSSQADEVVAEVIE